LIDLLATVDNIHAINDSIEDKQAGMFSLFSLAIVGGALLPYVDLFALWLVCTCSGRAWRSVLAIGSLRVAGAQDSKPLLKIRGALKKLKEEVRKNQQRSHPLYQPNSIFSLLVSIRSE